MRHFESAEVDLLRCLVRLPYLANADLQLTYLIFIFFMRNHLKCIDFHLFTLAVSICMHYVILGVAKMLKGKWNGI